MSNFRGSYVFGSRATYHCNPGFILWGNSTRLCDSTGQWTGQAPRCSPISCGDPPMLPHSAVALLNGSTQWKSLAVYSCLPGYIPLSRKYFLLLIDQASLLTALYISVIDDYEFSY